MNGIGAKTGNVVIQQLPNDIVQDCLRDATESKNLDGHTTKWYDEHYQGDIQPIEYMQAQFSKQEFIGGLLFNIIKYSSRLGKKDDPLKEARKILRYSQWLVEALEGKKINPRE